MLKTLVLLLLLGACGDLLAQQARSRNCDAVPQAFGAASSSLGALTSKEACKATVDQDRRLGDVETELNPDRHLQGAPSRLKTLERLRGDDAASAASAARRIDSLEKINADERIKQLEVESERSKETVGLTQADIRRAWVLLAAMLVFFMQAGFKCLEVGMARSQHAAGTALLNLSNWMVLCLVYWLAGFAFMFGPFPGLEDPKLYSPGPNDFTAYDKTLKFEFFLFQLGFAGTAATIVDGALAERVTQRAYFAIAAFMGLIIYPVFGHWAWGGAIDGTNQGWLAERQFKDFAGSTVVHSIGAWVAWTGAHRLGRRRLGFLSEQERRPYNLGYSMLGVMMLWFSWWGFNGGSLSKFNDPDFFGQVARVIQNTNLAGAAAGIAGYFFALAAKRGAVVEKTIGATLGGLVAITASCDTVHPYWAIVIGAVAGLLHNWAFDWLSQPGNKLGVDDVAGAIPVHGFCGVLGTLCATFGTKLHWFEQLQVQLLGIGAGIIWGAGISYVFFLLVERYLGLRSSVKEEDMGRNAE